MGALIFYGQSTNVSVARKRVRLPDLTIHFRSRRVGGDHRMPSGDSTSAVRSIPQLPVCCGAWILLLQLLQRLELV